MDGLHHLMNAMQIEPSSFLQRCICYEQEKKITFFISLGHVVQVYPYVLLLKYLERPRITFKAWNKKDGGGEFDFDTQIASSYTAMKPDPTLINHYHCTRPLSLPAKNHCPCCQPREKAPLTAIILGLVIHSCYRMAH